MSSVVEIKSGKTKKSTGEISREMRYCISSLKTTAKDFNDWIRSYRAVESKLHRLLDVTFREDFSRKRRDNASENFNIVLKYVLTMLARYKTYTGCSKRKKVKATFHLTVQEQTSWIVNAFALYFFLLLFCT
jgi:predicted transposase YbfD/YdcC